jgi:hypothetical protein
MGPGLLWVPVLSETPLPWGPPPTSLLLGLLEAQRPFFPFSGVPLLCPPSACLSQPQRLGRALLCSSVSCPAGSQTHSGSLPVPVLLSWALHNWVIHASPLHNCPPHKSQALPILHTCTLPRTRWARPGLCLSLQPSIAQGLGLNLTEATVKPGSWEGEGQASILASCKAALQAWGGGQDMESSPPPGPGIRPVSLAPHLNLEVSLQEEFLILSSGQGEKPHGLLWPLPKQ